MKNKEKISKPKVGVYLDNDDVKIPDNAYKDDIGYDLYAIEDVEIPYGLMREVHTGVHLSLPKGLFAQINTRSSYGKKGMYVHHGVIDPGFTGELTLFVFNISTQEKIKEPFTIKKGDKVAQLLFHRAEYVKINRVNSLPKTERGENRIGSSGS